MIVDSSNKSQLEISGDLGNCRDGLPVSVHKPIGKFYDSSSPTLITRVNNNCFSFFLPVDVPAFITVSIDARGQVFPLECTLFVSPGDKISLHKSTRDDRFLFEGNNAAGHNYYNGGLDYPAVGDEFKQILAESNTPEVALDSIKKLIDQCTSPLDSLLQDGKISSFFRENTKRSVELSIMHQLTHMLFIELSGRKKISTLNDGQLRLLLAWLYTSYDPFNPDYARTPTCLSTALFKCSVISRIVEESAEPGTDFSLFGGEYEQYANIPSAKRWQFIRAMVSGRLAENDKEQRFIKKRFKILFS